MIRLEGGWHEVVAPAVPGIRYRYRLSNGEELPDPASRCQPDGIHGPSEVVDLSRYPWQHRDWAGRPWHEAVLYELHVGTFTPQGTFRAAMQKLPQLAALGVTAIELMPVAAFAGARNWGYDGVFPYAPASSYGRPEDLQALVDAAHGEGLMVILDVVYNHFGPQGSVIQTFAPPFFTDRHPTPWGAGINFDGPAPVRDFFIENALHWIDGYRMDGLRLDAVHAIADDSEPHIVDAIAQTVAHAFGNRHVHLVLENEHNEARRLAREQDRPLLFTAQWNDDVHHALHVASTAESSGYYADYVGDRNKLAKSLAEGFCFQGETMSYSGRPRGEPSRHLPPVAFVSFLQNHDQIGNRAFGDRLARLAPPEVIRALAAVYLLLPQIPMLFMGEEWGAQQPFPFFCDFCGDLRRAVVEGRRNEFARFPEFSAPEQRSRIPDPCSSETFASAKLRWEDADSSTGRQTLEWYRQILAARHREIVPRLPKIRCAGQYVVAGDIVEARWPLADDDDCIVLIANLSPHATDAPPVQSGRLIWREGSRLGPGFKPWTVEWSIYSHQDHHEHHR